MKILICLTIEYLFTPAIISRNNSNNSEGLKCKSFIRKCNDIRKVNGGRNKETNNYFRRIVGGIVFNRTLITLYTSEIYVLSMYCYISIHLSITSNLIPNTNMHQKVFRDIDFCDYDVMVTSLAKMFKG